MLVKYQVHATVITLNVLERSRYGTGKGMKIVWIKPAMKAVEKIRGYLDSSNLTTEDGMSNNSQ